MCRYFRSCAFRRDVPRQICLQNAQSAEFDEINPFEKWGTTFVHHSEYIEIDWGRKYTKVYTGLENQQAARLTKRAVCCLQRGLIQSTRSREDINNRSFERRLPLFCFHQKCVGSGPNAAGTPIAAHCAACSSRNARAAAATLAGVKPNASIAAAPGAEMPNERMPT